MPSMRPVFQTLKLLIGKLLPKKITKKIRVIENLTVTSMNGEISRKSILIKGKDKPQVSVTTISISSALYVLSRLLSLAWRLFFTDQNPKRDL